MIDEAAPSSAFESYTRHSIERQIAAAKMYPRSISRFLEAARALIVSSQATAEACIYVLPRQDKEGNDVSVPGPSARFAEILAATYQNLRVSTAVMPVGPDDREVSAWATFHDVENNVVRAVECKRLIVTAAGGRLPDEVVSAISAGAANIAARNATLQGIPRSVWQPLYEAAVAGTIGNAEEFVDIRARTIAQLAKMGVAEERVLAYCKVDKVEQITPDTVLELRGIASAIREGDVRPASVFADGAVAPSVRSLRDRVVASFAPAPALPAPPTSEAPLTCSECAAEMTTVVNDKPYCDKHAALAKAEGGGRRTRRAS